MKATTRPTFLASLVPFAIAVLLALPLASSQVSSVHAAPVQQARMNISCAQSPLCTEVQNSEEVFGAGDYVGHDEPATLFYSNRPGAGNQMVYTLKLPTDPKTGPSNVPKPGQSFNFQLHPAFWFGMDMCDTQSYPEQVSTCTPDSDSNIFDGQDAQHPISQHPGGAFMEMQFYPPGWVSWPANTSCDATKWCAALNIDSLSEDPVNGTTLNATCAAQVGLEYVNFAFITKNGKTQPNSPPNPVQSTINTFTPDRNADLFMNSGDTLVVNLYDTAHGLRIDIFDATTLQSGSMTASATNGFGQVQYDPTGTSCTNIPYDFHPMYSTSSEHTRVPWTAHSYNIAFSDEIGHFEACNGPNAITPGGACPAGNTEFDGEPSDANDIRCFPASSSLLVQTPGCTEPTGVSGFDSNPYHPIWPDGNTALHPTSLQFTSPLTGRGFNYSRMAFEADLPRVEAPDEGGACNIATGANCTLIPITDDGQPADFYPFYSAHQENAFVCTWLLGNDVPGMTTNDFGKNNQYGSLLFMNFLSFGGKGATRSITTNFRQIMANPCKVGFLS